MKQFFKQVFATMVGISMWLISALLIAVVSIVCMALSDSDAKEVKPGSVMKITLKGTLDERSQEEDFMSIMLGDDYGSTGLDDLVRSIDAAAENDNVEGIYIEVGAFDGGQPAMLQELRQALVRFRKNSGKWIVAYGDTYTQGAYYVCSAANELYANHYGLVDWHGLASQPIFYTDLLKKVGVKFQVFKVGKFKSAVEPYINTEMSEANREQVQAYLGSIWNQLLTEVADGRTELTTSLLDSLADETTLLKEAEELTADKFIDGGMYIDELKACLRAKLGLKDDKAIYFVEPKDVLAAVDEKEHDDKIAVYYAVGEIQQISPRSFSSDETIDMETMVRDLQKLREDDDIKAVVLRVNSPGGSAFASEQIWREVQLLKEKKPVVVSMGGLAASGGYYISCGASKIIAEPMTLTGSIGIFGLVPDATELLTDKLELHFDVVKTNRHSDFGALGRSLDEEECNMMQAYVERGYALFLKRVADGRNMETADVDSIGQGRVWTGEQALKLNLVDALGDLQDAIREASSLAELSEYSVVSYPEQKSWFEQLAEDKEEHYLETRMKASLGDLAPAVNLLEMLTRPRRFEESIYARLPYEVVIK